LAGWISLDQLQKTSSKKVLDLDRSIRDSAIRDSAIRDSAIRDRAIHDRAIHARAIHDRLGAMLYSSNTVVLKKEDTIC